MVRFKIIRLIQFSKGPPHAWTERVLPVIPKHINLSGNIALRSLEVPGLYLFHNAEIIEDLLATITSLVFSEMVLIFSEGVHLPPRLGEVLRGLHGIKDFGVAFCLETLEELRVLHLHRLTLETREAAAGGAFDFLPHPPLVFSRTVTRYDRAHR